MPISPRDIKAKVFKKVLFGYRTSEVDSFFDETSTSLEGLRKENDLLKVELHSLKMKILKYEEQSAVIRDSMVTAQDKANQMINEGKMRGQIIFENAKEKAELLLKDYESEFNRRKQLLYEFKEISDSYKRKFHSMIEKQWRMMEDFEASFESRRAIGYVSDYVSEQKVRNPVPESDWCQNSCRIRKRSK